MKDDTDDFVVVAASAPVAAAGVFTRSVFAGPSVRSSRSSVADHRAQAVVIVSKNANVANGQEGVDDNRAVVAAVAARLGCDPGDILIASTGVIGRRYPIDRMLAGIDAMPSTLDGRDIARPARGHHDHRHRAEDRRAHRRRERGAGRRDGEGLGNDRAQHGHDDRASC